MALALLNGASGDSERLGMNDKIVRGVEIVKANISLPMSFTPDSFPISSSLTPP